MTMVNDIVNEVQKIKGLDGYIVIQDDGEMLSYNVVNAEELSALIIMTVVNANFVKSDLGATFFKHFIMTRKTKEKLLIFPIGNLLLGLLQRSDTYTPDIVNKVQSMIHGLKE